MHLADVRYSWRPLRAGRLLLDGGSMFGVVPRSVWTRTLQPDDRNRIELQHNCLLLESPKPGGGTRRVLIETGTGNKLDEKMSAIFGLENRYIHDAVEETGCSAADVDAVIVSHLHFDHAGGLTRRPSAGENGGEHNAVPTFANAEVIVQQREWNDALANKSVMTRTYYRDHLEPIRDRVRCVDSPRPFPTGYTPRRDEDPMGAVDTRTTEVLPGIGVFLVPGHTWGQQAVVFRDTEDRTIVFTPDVMPTAWHLGAAYSLAYDVEPYTSMVTKRWFLREAARRGWTLFLDHEPGNPLRRVAPDGDWFSLTEADTP